MQSFEGFGLELHPQAGATAFGHTGDVTKLGKSWAQQQ